MPYPVLTRVRSNNLGMGQAKRCGRFRSETNICPGRSMRFPGISLFLWAKSAVLRRRSSCFYRKGNLDGSALYSRSRTPWLGIGMVCRLDWMRLSDMQNRPPEDSVATVADHRCYTFRSDPTAD